MKFNWVSTWQKTKEAKANENRIERNRIKTELEEFCEVGDIFYYLGLEMLCTSHRGTQEWNYDDPGIRVEYVNPVTGEIVKKFFDASHLPTLEKEHARNKHSIFSDSRSNPSH